MYEKIGQSQQTMRGRMIEALTRLSFQNYEVKPLAWL
jgi:hypothetical protein